jgi:DnaJ like chaperone protein
MAWVGKAIGSVVGFVTAGPIGSLLGLLVGHQFDQGYGTYGTVLGEHRATGEIQSQFFETTFAVMGHIAKVDGRVSEQEIRMARGVMHAMHLTPEQVQAAIGHFTHGKRSDFPLQDRVERLQRALSRRPDLARAFVDIQLQALIGAHSLGAAERSLLWRVAEGLGVGRAELAGLEAQARARSQQHAKPGTAELGLDDAYRILGVLATAADKDIKTAYRRLMNRHHPDKLVARGLPESMSHVAQQRTQEIRAAYERIKAARNFR